MSWTEHLAESRQVEVEGPPAGWKSVREVAKEIGKSEAHTQNILNSEWRAGRVERRSYPRWTGVRFYPCFYYNWIEK